MSEMTLALAELGETDIVTRLENRIRGLDKLHADTAARIPQLEARIAREEEELAKPFRRQAELDEAEETLRHLDAQVAALALESEQAANAGEAVAEAPDGADADVTDAATNPGSARARDGTSRPTPTCADTGTHADTGAHGDHRGRGRAAPSHAATGHDARPAGVARRSDQPARRRHGSHCSRSQQRLLQVRASGRAGDRRDGRDRRSRISTVPGMSSPPDSSMTTSSGRRSPTTSAAHCSTTLEAARN